jgi:hypothetical protein
MPVMKIRIYTTIILLLVLDGCEARFLTLREHKLRVSVDQVVREIFELKKDEVSEKFEILQNEELRDLNGTPCIVKIVKPKEEQWTGNLIRI